jgi:hypothetical protein
MSPPALAREEIVPAAAMSAMPARRVRRDVASGVSSVILILSVIDGLDPAIQ